MARNDTNLKAEDIEYSNAKHYKIYVNNHLLTTENVAEFNSYFNISGGDDIKYTCDVGYQFVNTVKIRYGKSGGKYETPQMTMSENNTVATFHLVSDGWQLRLALNDNTQILSNVIPVSTSLDNCTLSPALANIPKNSASNFTITADNGFKFTSAPSVYTMADGERYAVEVTKVSDYVYTFSVTPDEYDESLNIYADAVSETVSLIKTLSNCSVSPAGNTLTIGVPVTLTITANSGYMFSEPLNEPSLYWLDGDETRHYLNVVKVSDYEYTATFTPDETDYYLDASAIAEPESVSFEKNLTNCSVSPNVNSLIDGETYSFIFKADSGYIFDVAPSLRYNNSEGDYITCPLTKISDYEYRYNNLTIDADDMTAFYATAYASVESVSSNKYGVLQIHKIDADTLKAFNDLRYYSGSGSLQQIDLSQYISALKVIFVDATSTASDNILVSNVNTGISAPKIDDDYITLDLGNVLLAGMYHNALDKKYSEILLNLPFVDVYKLDSDYMNETINIKYRINLISGDGAIFISIVRNSVLYLIDVINVSMSFDLPYIYPIESDIKQLNTKIKAVNFNISPSVTIKQRLKADANNSVYQCYKIDTPANENGYFKIERLDADTIPASASIRNKIENLLKAGVYI